MLELHCMLQVLVLMMISSCKKLVDWADIIRKTFYDGGIEEIISTRRLVHIIRAYAIFKNKAKGNSSLYKSFR